MQTERLLLGHVAEERQVEICVRQTGIGFGEVRGFPDGFFEVAFRWNSGCPMVNWLVRI